MCTGKFCGKCKTEKPPSDFHKDRTNKDGLYTTCKSCKRAARMATYRKRREEDPISLWVHNARWWAKCRANRKNLQFNLEYSDVSLALASTGCKCAYCGITLNFRGTMRTRRDSPTIDRIVPSIGYISNNIVVCCYRCNMIKNEATAEELAALAKAVATLITARGLTPRP